MAIHRSEQRGKADFGWLDSRHSFSFGSWYDPRYLGFGHLRVINEDHVAAGGGFPTHPHRNMEIVSYVIDGALEHRDTLGTGSVIRPGEVQLMSAGRGIAHSEMNHSGDDPVHFLQIWLLPAEGNTEPRYEQRAFPMSDDDGLRLVVSPDGRDGSLTIGQNVDLWRLLLPAEGTAELPLARQRAWVQVIRGGIDVNGARLQAGDGLAVEDAQQLGFLAHDDGVEALVFDLV